MNTEQAFKEHKVEVDAARLRLSEIIAKESEANRNLQMVERELREAKEAKRRALDAYARGLVDEGAVSKAREVLEGLEKKYAEDREYFQAFGRLRPEAEEHLKVLKGRADGLKHAFYYSKREKHIEQIRERVGQLVLEVCAWSSLMGFYDPEALSRMLFPLPDSEALQNRARELDAEYLDNSL